MKSVLFGLVNKYLLSSTILICLRVNGVVCLINQKCTRIVGASSGGSIRTYSSTEKVYASQLSCTIMFSNSTRSYRPFIQLCLHFVRNQRMHSCKPFIMWWINYCRRSPKCFPSAKDMFLIHCDCVFFLFCVNSLNCIVSKAVQKEERRQRTSSSIHSTYDFIKLE